MAFLKKVFSGSYRKATQLEAEGDFRGAARAYAEAEEHEKVIDMHMRAAQAATAADQRIEVLTAALNYAEGHEEVRSRVSEAARALADQLAALARDGGIVTELDRRKLGEAAAMWAKAGDYELAGDAVHELGRLDDAANYYKQGGAIGKMESVYAEEQQASERAKSLRNGWSAYEQGFKTGDRAAALAGIQTCFKLAPENPDYRSAHDDLQSRWPRGGLLTGRLGAQRLAVIGSFPANLGRDEECAIVLRDAGVSRVHAVLDQASDGFTVRDAGSKNGTRLDGLPAAEERPLGSEGIVSVGLSLDFAYAVRRGHNGSDTVLNLEVVRGMDKGAVFILSSGEMLPRRVGGAADLPAVPAGFFVQDGLVWIRPTGEQPLDLNGESVSGPILPIRGDRIRMGELLLEVD